MKFIFEVGLLTFVIAFMLASAEASAQTPPPLVPGNQTTTTTHARSLFGVTNTFNVSVYCSSGQVQKKSATVSPGQPLATINVNCGGGGGTGQQSAPPATICIVTPTNKCASAFTNQTGR